MTCPPPPPFSLFPFFCALTNSDEALRELGFPLGDSPGVRTLFRNGSCGYTSPVVHEQYQGPPLFFTFRPEFLPQPLRVRDGKAPLFFFPHPLQCFIPQFFPSPLHVPPTRFEEMSTVSSRFLVPLDWSSITNWEGSLRPPSKAKIPPRASSDFFWLLARG